MSWPFPDLRRLFAPRSVAYIGATEDLRKFGGRCIRELIDFGYRGPIYPINPKREQVFGYPCHASVDALPEVPDHVGIVLPAQQVPDAVEACAARGVPFATVFTSGFAEMGTSEARALQARIVEIARAGNLRLVGPNCNGMVNFVDRVAMTSTAAIRGPRRAAGDIGVVSHSGGAGQVNVMWRAQEAGLGISYQISCGNDSDLDLLDYMAFMVDDPGTKVVLALAERLSSGEKLRALAAKAAALGKPIVMVKVGRSSAGSRMAASHTGAITGADDVCTVALEQFGIMRVDDCFELYEAAMLLRRAVLPKGPRLAATSISGGNLVMVADLGGTVGLEFPAYEARTQQSLRDLLPGFGVASNPTDLTAMAIGRDDVFTSVCRALHDDDNVDVVMPVLTFSPAADVRSLAAFAADAAKPVAFLWTGPCSDDPALTAASLVSSGIAVYRDPLPAMKALRTAVRYQACQARLRDPDVPVRPSDLDRATCERYLERATGTMNEHESKAVLATYGLRAAREAVAQIGGDAVRIARTLGGAVALKVLSSDLPHKTEAGAIALDVTGDAAVGQAFDRVIDAARRYRPDARIDGVVVQEMVTGGAEFIVGVSRDETFGPVVTVGLGGVHVELFRDVAMRLPPIGPRDALEMLRSLRAFPILEGTRGSSPLDIDALVDAIVRVSWLAVDHRSVLVELDVNPLRVLPRGHGVRVVDALIVRGDPSESEAPARSGRAP
ncbi:MAG: acetate--CoA ligase family protein [Lautropia sp.]